MCNSASISSGDEKVRTANPAARSSRSSARHRGASSSSTQTGETALGLPSNGVATGMPGTTSWSGFWDLALQHRDQLRNLDERLMAARPRRVRGSHHGVVPCPQALPSLPRIDAR